MINILRDVLCKDIFMQVVVKNYLHKVIFEASISRTRSRAPVVLSAYCSPRHLHIRKQGFEPWICEKSECNWFHFSEVSFAPLSSEVLLVRYLYPSLNRLWYWMTDLTTATSDDLGYVRCTSSANRASASPPLCYESAATRAMNLFKS